jgi:hypothetical protein
MRSTKLVVMFFVVVVPAWLALTPAASAIHGPPVLVSTGPSDNSSDPVSQIQNLSGVGISTDGSRIFFTSSLHLVPGDEDGTCPETYYYGPHPCSDVYERSGGQTTLVSTGPTSGVGDATFAGASDDGSRVFFETDEALVPEDRSRSFGRPNGLDVYERTNGQTTLISTGPRGNATTSEPSRFLHTSPDGARVLFSSVNPLVPEDTNAVNDIYERFNGTTTLISTGPPGPGSAPVQYVGASRDGTRVFFLTGSPLVPTDTDNQTDLYERSGGQTTLLSTGPSGGNGPWSVPFNGFAGASEDGGHVFFATQESLVPSDTDSCGTDQFGNPNPCLDIYERFDGQTTLVSTGPNSNASNEQHILGVSHVPGVVSADGSTVYFETYEPLVPSDTDGTAIDVYKWSGGRTTLVSTGPAGGNSPNHSAFLAAASRDGRDAFFRTYEALVSSDTDNAQDLYERTGSTTTLVSTGPNGGNADVPAYIDTGGFPPSNFFPSASLVFFVTAEALVPDDTNATTDVYERSNGQTYLVPAVPGGGGAQYLAGLTPDGRTVLWYTTKALVPSDKDAASDLYAATVPNHPPNCSGVAASRAVLKTVNRGLIAITLDGATDPDGDPVTLSVDGVTQDEPVTGRGDHTSPDAVDASDGEVRVRAERDPHGDGRVYRIAFTASDGRGGSCSGTATVSVPRKKGEPAVDSAPPSYDSLSR